MTRTGHVMKSIKPFRTVQIFILFFITFVLFTRYISELVEECLKIFNELCENKGNMSLLERKSTQS